MSELLVREASSLTDPSPPAVGDVLFCDNYLPPLKEGTYSISITQTLENPGDGQSLQESFYATQQFSVVGPRFGMPGTDIQSVYPPDKSQGQYEEYLPYIVLTKRALPWEIKLSSTAPDSTPWLALLLFTADELCQTSSTNNPTKASTYTVEQMTQSETGILKPNITLTPPLDDPSALCQAIDITPATFQSVVPHDNELAYLTHCRQVNLQDKTEGQLNSDGWFSVVLANRLPKNITQQPIQYIAHLVSLEGFAAYIQANQPTSIPSGTQYVRLISLASWTFNCLPQPKEDFAQLMKNLVQGQSQGGDGLLLKMPLTGAATTPDQQLAQTIVNRGYVPLTYQVQTGEQTYAWYRGPLSAVPVTDNPPATPYSAAEAALIYDQDTGVFDQSYAVAWQTGRLLALADRSFALSLLNWRQQGRQTVNLLYHRLNSPYIAADLKQTQTMEQLRSLLHPKLVSESFMTYLGTDFAKGPAQHIANLGSEATHPYQFQQHTESSTSQPQSTKVALIGNLKRFMQHPDMPTLLPQAMVARMQAAGATIGDAPTNAIPQDIVDWLTRLCLLYGVPFNNLLPNAAMLPVESIRFFYVDPNFIDGLVDGALSLGIHSSQDSLFNQVMQSHVHTAVYQTLPSLRHQLAGTQPDADGYQPTPPLAGFVLRSAAIAGWPGLEIKLYRDSQGTQPMTAVRTEQIAADVLLCLCDVIPARIEFDEPKEGLRFGVEDNDAIYLRSLGANGAIPGTQLLNDPTVTAPFRDQTTGVFDIGQLAVTLLTQQLQSAGQLPAGTTISPSQFAIQLVRLPEQMVFQNQS